MNRRFAAKVIIDESRVGHIFRRTAGHFDEDTLVNRRILLDVAGRPENYVGTDRFGNDWFAASHADGQIWAHVRDGRKMNGGVNTAPRDFTKLLGAGR